MIHGGMWILKFFFDRYIVIKKELIQIIKNQIYLLFRFYHYQHMKSRRHGYLTFYRVTRLIRSIPLLIISASKLKLLLLIF